jgi:methyl-accepting chemotaxis protein
MTSDEEPEKRETHESSKLERVLDAILSVYFHILSIFLPRPLRRRYIKTLKILGVEFEPQPLVERARQVTDALTKASELVDELKAEVEARSAIIQSLASQTKEAEQRTEDAIRRAHLTEEEARAVDSYLDRTVANRLAEFEKRAKKREWALATIVALIVGVASILIAHFLFRF